MRQNLSKIAEATRDIVEGLKEFLNEVGERIKGWFDGTYTDTSIQISVSSLADAADTIKPVAQRLEQCREEVAQIQKRLGVWAGVYVTRLIVQESRIEGLESSCGKFANALNDIAGIYASTENEIIEYLQIQKAGRNPTVTLQYRWYIPAKSRLDVKIKKERNMQ